MAFIKAYRSQHPIKWLRMRIYLSDEVFGHLREVVWLGNICVGEEILIRVVGLVAVAHKELEEVE